MKIGIITHWGSKDNYGQLLQAFALQKFLGKLGHTVYLIRFDLLRYFLQFSPWYLLNPKKIVVWIVRLYRHILRICSASPHDRHFMEFQNEYMNLSERIYTSVEQLQKFYPEADAYITGSDMVWCGVPPFPPFYLQFGKKETLRLSYAAGMGFKYPATEKNISLHRDALMPFSFVSVREQQGVDICRKAGREDVVLVPDPVFLHTKDFYYNTFRLPEQTQPVLLIYLVGNKCHVPYRELELFAQKKGLQIRFIASQGQKSHKNWEQVWPSPDEFLVELAQAAYVVTNSFHGTALSIIFQKKLMVLPLKSLDDRIATITKRFHILDGVYNGIELHFSDLTQRTDIESLMKADIDRIAKLLQHVLIAGQQ